MDVWAGYRFLIEKQIKNLIGDDVCVLSALCLCLASSHLHFAFKAFLHSPRSFLLNFNSHSRILFCGPRCVVSYRCFVQRILDATHAVTLPGQKPPGLTPPTHVHDNAANMLHSLETCCRGISHKQQKHGHEPLD